MVMFKGFPLVTDAKVFGLVIHIMTSSHAIPFEEASLKLEELPQAVRLAEQLGDRKLRKGGVLSCMMVKQRKRFS